MGRFQGNEILGLRDWATKRAIAVYPDKIEGTDKEIEDKIKFWYYQQSCSAEEQLESSFVDVITPEETEALQNNPNSCC